MAINFNALKALFSKLKPAAKAVAPMTDDVARLGATYGDDIARGVTNYGDDVARAVTNYGDDALAVADNLDDLPFVGTRPDVRNRFPTSYDLDEVFDIGDNLVGHELSDVKIGDRWFRYPRQSYDYVEDIDWSNLETVYTPRYSDEVQRLRNVKRGLLDDFMDGTRRYDAPVSSKLPSAISTALNTSPDTMTYSYKKLLESNPHLKKLYSKLNPRYDWDSTPVDDLPF